ncbi:MAG: 5-oxoprolinase [Phycisphaerales bacterium]|nr:MAG: 5-oxoprolinase [Phycisphaerales bacterium]
MSRVWTICVDTGGTFTDCIACDPDGSSHRAKVLSSARLRARLQEQSDRTVRIAAPWLTRGVHLRGYSLRTVVSDADQNGKENAWRKILSHEPGDDWVELDEPLRERHLADADDATIELTTDEPAPILAARLVTGTPADGQLPSLELRLASTRGTNALLERAGAETALFITHGFRDLLLIGDQQRPDLFALDIRRPEPLPREIVEVEERLAADGCVLTELNADALRESARKLHEQGFRSAAVALLHSYRNDEHEKRVEEILREVGFEHVSCSAALAPLIEILPRAETASVDAYLAPVIASYVDSIASIITRRDERSETRLHVMTSAGGLVRADKYRAKDSLLSGPAGGVAGAAASARHAGIERVIGFDMGGTSTDVARIDGDFEYRFEQVVAGVRLRAPALAIETVAAGGGSICHYRHERLQVGPQSAGADPGPACYGAGGPLSITDINLLCGRIDPDQFEIPIDQEASRAALRAVREQISDASDLSDDKLLDGFLRIANERMADAIAQVSLRRGYDPADYALVSFGGAGGQHACALADMLNMQTVLMPADASLLSAVGLSAAVIERFSERQILQSLDEIGEELDQQLKAMASEAVDAVAEEGVDRKEIEIRRRMINLRRPGQDATLAVEVDESARPDDLIRQFAERYEQRYGHAPEDDALEVESLRVVASSRQKTAGEADELPRGRRRESDEAVRARFGGEWREVPRFRRDDLDPGDRVDGPALIFDQRSAYVIESGWNAICDSRGGMILERASDGASETEDRRKVTKDAPEVVWQELFTSRFASIAEEMGEVLQRTALSTNVKRRLDFSCAVLDANGELVVNAPHIPVHLGAMGMCVRAVAERIDMKPGDCIVTNHPGCGGSHLPDVTVISPVFTDDDELIGYVANRAHHAELGGTRPGSMPPRATTLAEEGVVIEPVHLIRQGSPCWNEMERVLREAPHPSRSVKENLADLRAAVAANHRGATDLRKLVEQHGLDEIRAQLAALADRAERLMREALAELEDGERRAVEKLDDGSELHVAIRINCDHAVIDFTGTSPRHAGNLNATPAIVRSAVLYVLRLLIGERLPLNEGILRAVEITLPECLLNPGFDEDPASAPAVVGGNTETSQRLVDTLLRALELVACSQGTMNNLLFGNDGFGYYETIAGGAGAGDDFDGASAVHTHMTNTRMTDPEVLEHRYPVRLQRYEIRRESGGAGRCRGGDGVVREIEFLEPVEISLLTQHRVEEPYGLNEGKPGACGRQRIVRKNGDDRTLESIDQCDAEPSDRLIIETPGGGGYGSPTESDPS